MSFCKGTSLQLLRGFVLILGLSELKTSDTMMMIPPPGWSRADGQSDFSDNIVIIEFCVPEKSRLSVIDAPGKFRTPEEGTSTDEDKMLVKNTGSPLRRTLTNYYLYLPCWPRMSTLRFTEILDMAAEVDSWG